MTPQNKHKQLKIEAVITYEPDIMYGNDEESKKWFFEEILKDELVLHSNEIGDEIGTMKITKIYEQT